jgi:hypothetical protein
MRAMMPARRSILQATAAAAFACLAARDASAWPSSLMQSLARDARRLLPPSLARLMAEREPQIFEATARFPPEVSQAVAADLGLGQLRPPTLTALDARTAEVVGLFRGQRVSEGVVRLGALVRIPADLADPVLAAGPEGYPPGVVQEYYAFVAASLDKIPVVLDDPAALKLKRGGLPGYWQKVIARSRDQSSVIRTELFQNGRVVDHRTIDYRSPVFGVASLSYSRAVTAIAATWLALWRDSSGDLTRIRQPVVVRANEQPVMGRSPGTAPAGARVP